MSGLCRPPNRVPENQVPATTLVEDLLDGCRIHVSQSHFHSEIRIGPAQGGGFRHSVRSDLIEHFLGTESSQQAGHRLRGIEQHEDDLLKPRFQMHDLHLFINICHGDTLNIDHASVSLRCHFFTMSAPC